MNFLCIFDVKKYINAISVLAYRQFVICQPSIVNVRLSFIRNAVPCGIRWQIAEIY